MKQPRSECRLERRNLLNNVHMRLLMIHRQLPTHWMAVVRRLATGGGAGAVNEVEAAGNTPLHAAAWQDWPEGVELLLQLGAKVTLARCPCG
jgi:hypothetical protein